MPITYHSDDILPHIEVHGMGAQAVTSQAPSLQAISPQAVGSPSAITAAETVSVKAVSLGGCVTVLPVIEICYSIAGSTLTVTAKLKTPVGDVNLGSVTLSPEHTTATIGGSIARFKAAVTFTFNYRQLSLEICAKACASLVGCTRGYITIRV